MTGPFDIASVTSPDAASPSLQNLIVLIHSNLCQPLLAFPFGRVLHDFVVPGSAGFIVGAAVAVDLSESLVSPSLRVPALPWCLDLTQSISQELGGGFGALQSSGQAARLARARPRHHESPATPLHLKAGASVGSWTPAESGLGGSTWHRWRSQMAMRQHVQAWVGGSGFGQSGKGCKAAHAAATSARRLTTQVSTGAETLEARDAGSRGIPIRIPLAAF